MEFTNRVGKRASELMEAINAQPDRPDREKELQEQAAKRQRQHAVAHLMGQLRGRADQRLVNWVDDTERKRRVRQAAIEWVAAYGKGERPSLVLFGPIGTGKDHLAAGVCVELAVRFGVMVENRNGQELFGRLREAIKAERDESEIRTLCQAEMLVLSDPVPVSGEITSHQANTLYRIAEGRSLRRLPTIVTINVANDQEAYQRLGAATWDRLCDGSWKIHMAWASYRKPKRVV